MLGLLWYAEILGLLLMVLSLFRVQHVVLVDYDAFEYGFPFPWLLYLVSGVTPVSMWALAPLNFLATLIFWVAIGFLVASLTSLRRGFRLLSSA